MDLQRIKSTDALLDGSKRFPRNKVMGFDLSEEINPTVAPLSVAAKLQCTRPFTKDSSADSERLTIDRKFGKASIHVSKTLAHKPSPVRLQLVALSL